jgi:oligoribonuclease
MRQDLRSLTPTLAFVIGYVAPMVERSDDNLLWIDLEMTGLDPQRDVIVQAAALITNDELEVLDELCLDVWQPPAELDKMSPFVREMHTRTGLLTRLSSSQTDVRDAERALIALATRWCNYPAVLCGNSIGHDRKFIDRYMPGLAGYLHYRMIDVSTLKVLASRWYGNGAMFKKSAEGEHDALVDIRNSINELRHYRDSLFKPR